MDIHIFIKILKIYINCMCSSQWWCGVSKMFGCELAMLLDFDSPFNRIATTISISRFMTEHSKI